MPLLNELANKFGTGSEQMATKLTRATANQPSNYSKVKAKTKHKVTPARVAIALLIRATKTVRIIRQYSNT